MVVQLLCFIQVVGVVSLLSGMRPQKRAQSSKRRIGLWAVMQGLLLGWAPGQTHQAQCTQGPAKQMPRQTRV